MDYFDYKNGELCCEEVPVKDIAAEAGTPVYIYSKATLMRHYSGVVKAFAELDAIICYSIKSCGNLHILKLFAENGGGFDVVSGGELARAQQVGADMKKIVFAGVGKTDNEIREALTAGIGWFNIESEQEFENLSRLAAETKTKTRAALRVNPDVFDPNTHAYTTTGKKETKFGVDIDRAEGFFEKYGRDENITLDGIHLHIGSPIYSPQPYVDAITKTLGLIEEIRAGGGKVNVLDIGGGFAADYEADKSPSAQAYADAIVPLLKGTGLQIILEPGRHIACNAGILLSQVLYTKRGGDKKFVIVDAAMTDLIRPALYEAEHFIYPAHLDHDEFPPNRRFDFAPANGEQVDIVGGVCETGDILGKSRTLPPMQRGDLLSIFSAGAYGFVMSSQYNARPRAAEVLVDGDSFKIIRRRENYNDVFAAEIF
ncbi:MAG: diaminopimelate decarboxylase [Phycisphaerae bacterium]|nr:diaminopimelate decarboxylase [Phycisphaerae bacterium]